MDSMRECKLCGGKFKPDKSILHRDVFCSSECIDTYYIYRCCKEIGYRKIVKECKFCGKEFEPSKYNVRHSWDGTVYMQVFCSEKCRNAYNRQQHRLICEKDKTICPGCGRKNDSYSFYKYCSICRGYRKKYKHSKKYKGLCRSNGCEEPIFKNGLCKEHYERWVKISEGLGLEVE